MFTDFFQCLIKYSYTTKYTEFRDTGDTGVDRSVFYTQGPVRTRLLFLHSADDVNGSLVLSGSKPWPLKCRCDL